MKAAEVDAVSFCFLFGTNCVCRTYIDRAAGMVLGRNSMSTWPQSVDFMSLAMLFSSPNRTVMEDIALHCQCRLSL